jgi:hypothetical protein
MGFANRAAQFPLLGCNKAGIIIDAEGTRANRLMEIAVTQTMVERVRRRFDLQPERLAGDTAYGAVRLLKWPVDRKITPHIPVWDKSLADRNTTGPFHRRKSFLFANRSISCRKRQASKLCARTLNCNSRPRPGFAAIDNSTRNLRFDGAAWYITLFRKQR